MEILFMVFMIFVSVMALFSVLVVLRDIVKEIMSAKKGKNEAANQPQREAQTAAVAPVAVAAAKESEVIAPVEEKVQPVAIVAPIEEFKEDLVIEPVADEVKEEPVAPIEEKMEETVTEPIVEGIKEEPASDVEEDAFIEQAKEDPDALAEDDNSVKFKAAQQTLEEKYLALDSAARGWYDEIIRHAMSIEGSKRVKNVRYEEYKVGNSRLVRLLIKRGVIYCDVYLNNSNFRNYVNENKISIKQSATTIRIDSDSTLEAVKNAIDIVVVSIAEEKEYKKQIMREKRRAARAALVAEAEETPAVEEASLVEAPVVEEASAAEVAAAEAEAAAQ